LPEFCNPSDALQETIVYQAFTKAQHYYHEELTKVVIRPKGSARTLHFVESIGLFTIN